jgi:hypothetical protein
MEATNPLARLQVLDARGQAVPLADAWRERTAVIALVRHFG